MFGGNNENRARLIPSIDWTEAESIVVREVDDITRRGQTLSGMHSVEDLRQEGMEAIIRASESFDAGYLVPFPLYARKAVSYALLRYLRATDPLPERSRRDLRKIRKAEIDLLREGIEYPTTAQVAAMSGLSEQRILRVKRESYEAVPGGLEEDAGRLDFPGLTGDTPEDRYLLWESRERIHRAIRSLTSRQRQVFQMRFIEQKSIAETSSELGISKGRVSQISSSVETVLRKALDGDAKD